MSAAKKNAFMLSSATLMVAKFGTKPVFDLDPANDSVGLAKELAVVINSSTVDLAAGVAQALVDSQKTNVQTTINGTVQEFSAENLLRAQGIATGARAQALRGTLKTAVNAAGVSLVLNDNPIPGEAASTLGTAAGAIKNGDTLLIQHPTIDGYVFPCRASADSTYAAPDHTVAIANAPIPAGMTFPVGSTVWVLSEMAVGSTAQSDLFSVKIMGTLANFGRPVLYVAPKVQITKGFNLSFTETQYGGMPWEMRALMLTASEASAGRLGEIGTSAAGKLYAA